MNSVDSLAWRLLNLKTSPIKGISSIERAAMNGHVKALNNHLQKSSSLLAFGHVL